MSIPDSVLGLMSDGTFGSKVVEGLLEIELAGLGRQSRTNDETIGTGASSWTNTSGTEGPSCKVGKGDRLLIDSLDGPAIGQRNPIWTAEHRVDISRNGSCQPKPLNIHKRSFSDMNSNSRDSPTLSDLDQTGRSRPYSAEESHFSTYSVPLLLDRPTMGTHTPPDTEVEKSSLSQKVRTNKGTHETLSSSERHTTEVELSEHPSTTSEADFGDASAEATKPQIPPRRRGHISQEEIELRAQANIPPA